MTIDVDEHPERTLTPLPEQEEGDSPPPAQPSGDPLEPPTAH